MRDSVQLKPTRDAILDATDRLLAKYGYRKMTIDDLAREVGIGKGTIYLHFPSKEEIALSHIDRIVERLKTRLSNIANGPATPKEKVRQMLIERVLYRFDSVQHYTQSLNEMLAQIRPKLLERRERHFEEEAQVFQHVLAEGRAAGIFAGNISQNARTLLTATNSLLPYSLSAQELGRREEIEVKIRHLAALLIEGLIKR